MTNLPIGQITQLENLLAMFKPNFNWDVYTGPSLANLFCAKVSPMSSSKIQRVECGSYKPAIDTPTALYRLVYLLNPPKVDFSDMYKNSLFMFFSTDGRFGVNVYLYKYELGLYFYAPKELVKDTSGGLWAGWPGADNDVELLDEEGKLFFEVVKAAIEYKWSVYPGNGFEV